MGSKLPKLRTSRTSPFARRDSLYPQTKPLRVFLDKKYVKKPVVRQPYPLGFHHYSDTKTRKPMNRNTLLFAFLATLFLPLLALGQIQREAAPASPPQDEDLGFVQAGKIWYSDDYLYVNLVDRGVLVYDNLNPRDPQRIGFIAIPGNVDMAVIGTTMYANSNDDLLVIDVSNPRQPEEVNRLTALFSHRARFGSSENTMAFRTGETLLQLLSNPIQSVFSNQGSNTISNNFGLNGGGIGGGMTMSAQPASQGPSGASMGGSMACFAIQGDYFYGIDTQDLVVLDISDPQNPREVGVRQRIGSDIETVFIHEDRIYIGSQDGMYIYSIAQPAQPKREGVYRHTRSCDPVVVEGNYAYVTLRDGTDCRGGVNQLDVVDVSNPARPRKVKTYPMTNPHGLGIDNGTLFICDGRAGLKIFDAQNPMRIEQTGGFRNIQTYDVIPITQRKHLIMVGSNQIFQYDYKSPTEVELLSKIDVQ